VCRLKQKYLWMLCASAVPVSATTAEIYPPVCRVPESTNSKQQITNNPSLNAVYLEADSGTIVRNGISELDGSVIIQQNKQTINANNAKYNGKTGIVNALGSVKLSSKNIDFSSDTIDYNLTQQTGTITNAQYQVRNSHTHGKSKQITKTEANVVELQGATYTTCSIMEPSWHISSKNINLNYDTQVGIAKGVTLQVSDIPVFYFPWLSFSLNNERKSGFLSPKLGSSDQSGYELKIPYYLNLAPNYDAMSSVSLLSKRGFKLENEFRFKTQNGDGAINYDFFPEDRQYNDQWRDHFKLTYKYDIDKKSKFTLKAEGVSDDDYFSDSSDTLISSSTSSLERKVAYTREGKNWEFSASAVDHQVLDTSSQPYAKLPELRYNYKKPHKYNSLDLSLDTEATYFKNSHQTTGLRFDVGLEASKRFGNDAFYIKPSLEYRVTKYSLNNNSAGNSLSRNLPTFNLDSGMFFDRAVGDSLIQTLEPRLFYTYTPYEDQSSIPTFDTTLTDFSTTTGLFKSNRFTGKDRIGDANQLTLALTSRIQDPKTGKEKLKASAGQVFYFSDRRVTLPGQPTLTTEQSEFAFELTGQLNDRTNFSTTLLWDTEKSDWSSKEARINYQDEQKRSLHLSYQHLDNELSEVDISLSLPLNPKWTLLGRADYDLFNNRSLELLTGIEYKDCCWATRFVARRYLTSDNLNYDDALFFEVELKGLGSAGNNARSILQEKTYGYEKN